MLAAPETLSQPASQRLGALASPSTPAQAPREQNGLMGDTGHKRGSLLLPPRDFTQPPPGLDLPPPPSPVPGLDDFIPPPPPPPQVPAPGDTAIGPPAGTPPGAWKALLAPAEREKRAREILSSEQTYVEFLAVIATLFVEPLKRDAMGLTRDDCLAVFSNVEVIYTCHQDLLAKIARRVAAWGDDACIGDVFLEGTGFIKLYKYYVNNYASATGALRRCRAKSRAFDRYLQGLEYTPKMRNSHLEDFLVAPVQRVMRYGMLLEELLRYTPTCHPDHAQLARATDTMKGVAEYMNEKKRDAEAMERFAAFLAQLTGFHSDAVRPSPRRVLLREGPVTLNREKMYFLLFSDCLFVTKPPKRDRYAFRLLLPLSALAVTAIGETAVRLTRTAAAPPDERDGSDYVLSFADVDDARLWFHALHSAVEDEHDSALMATDGITDNAALFSTERESERREKRRALVAELLRSETAYCDFLAHLCETFVEPIKKGAARQPPLVGPDAARPLGLYVDRLRAFHTGLLTDIQGIVDDYDDARTGLSGLVRDHLSVARFYITYIAHVDEIQAAITRATADYMAFNFWLCDVEAKEHAQLCTLLERPLRRVTEFYVTLNEILNCTNRTHPDYEPLKAAIAKLKAVKEDVSLAINTRDERKKKNRT